MALIVLPFDNSRARFETLLARLGVGRKPSPAEDESEPS